MTFEPEQKFENPDGTPIIFNKGIAGADCRDVFPGPFGTGMLDRMRIMRERHFTGTRLQAVTQRKIKNREIARRAAAEGIVLLENRNGQHRILRKGQAEI